CWPMLTALNTTPAFETNANNLNPRLQALRQQIGALDGSHRVQTYQHTHLPDGIGIPKGAVVELLGPSRYEFVAHFLAQHDRPCLWLQKEFSFFPTALLQRGVDLRKSVFVEAGDNVQWVLKQVLQSQVFPFLVGEDLNVSEKDLRKFQLLAERAGATLLHLCS